MQIIRTLAKMQKSVARRDRSQVTGFVPTMGFLHQGHLSLVERCRENCDICVVSIFVNPAQFGPKEDLANYPRDLEQDLKLLSKYGVDQVFLPTQEDMYPSGYRTWVEVEGWSSILCGASRPGHFRGVATVVLKLLHLVQPQKMFMGSKDFQQTVILEKLLQDLNLETRIIRCPIVREADGLAMSSRNSYLNAEQRIQARCLFQALQQAKILYQQGTNSSQALIQVAREIISAAGGRPDYIKLVDATTLEERDEADDNTRLLLAVFIGTTRLIDNDALSA